MTLNVEPRGPKMVDKDAKLSEALELNKLGLHLFPLRVDAKEPVLGPSWFDLATDDVMLVAERWGGGGGEGYGPGNNIGIDCGASNIVVVDVDHDKYEPGLKRGYESWRKLSDGHPRIETFTVQTRHGGMHLYFRVDPDMGFKNSQSVIGDDIDVRAVGGYVVGPGSTVGPDSYEVVKRIDIAPLPEWLAEVLRAAEKKPVRSFSAIDLSKFEMAEGPEFEAHVDKLMDEIRNADHGSGYKAINSAAFKIGQYAGAGQITPDYAYARCYEAISGWTFRDGGNDKTIRTIVECVDDGILKPRAWVTIPKTRFPKRMAELLDSGGIELSTESVIEAVDVVDGKAVTKESAEGRDAAARLMVDQLKEMSDWSTDAGQARWFAGENRDIINVPRVGLLRWDGRRWAPEENDNLSARVIDFYRQKFEAAVAKYEALASADVDDDDKDRHQEELAAAEGMVKFLKFRQGWTMIKAVVAIVKCSITLPGSNAVAQLDANRDLINTPSGVINLRTLEVMPHSHPDCPGLLMTHITSGSYRKGFTHPDWDAAAKCLPKEIWDYMQLRLGAALTGTSKVDTCLFLFGGGSNGKSVILNDGVMNALGDYGHLAPAHILSGGGGKDGALSPDKAELRGKRVVLIEELDEASPFSANEVKRLVATGTLTARTLNQPPITFQSTHTLFITTNSKPRVTEVTDAIWRRILLVEFKKRFTPNPVHPDDLMADIGIDGRISSNESDQHDAIMTWIIDGAARHFADVRQIKKGMEPKAVADWTYQWRLEADTMLAYMMERIVIADKAMIWTKDLYDDLQRWLAMNGYSSWSRKVFLDRFTGHDHVKTKIRRTRAKNHEGISRPDVVMTNSVAAVPDVLVGVRFRTEADDRAEWA